MEQPRCYLKEPKVKNFVNYCLMAGGYIKHIPFNNHDSNWPGWCNQSIMWDEEDQEFKMVLRNVNHLMHNNGQVWANGCRLLYSNPSRDGRNLKTQNWIGSSKDPLKEDFNFTLIHTDPYTPIWEFQGQEDGRIVRWNGQLLTTGVRRDNNTVGRGRMEVMFLEKKEDGYHQGFTQLVQGPNNDSTYCEKNWMPMKDMPYHYIRTANPTTICKVNAGGGIEDVITKEKQSLGDLDYYDMIRGSSQVIPWKDGYIALVHTCEMWWTANGRKIAKYVHAFIQWDKDFNIIYVSPVFSFGDHDVEFSCGLEIHDGKFYIPFAVNDNVPFLLIVPENVIDLFISEPELPQIHAPFWHYPQDCILLHPNPDYNIIHNEAMNQYNQGNYAHAYSLFQTIVSHEDGYGHERVYDDLFMMTRCVADLSLRDEHEISMWYETLQWDASRPEAYLAISNYYGYRGHWGEAYYWASQALAMSQKYKGHLVFYKELDFVQNAANYMWQTKHYHNVLGSMGNDKKDSRAF